MRRVGFFHSSVTGGAFSKDIGIGWSRRRSCFQLRLNSRQLRVDIMGRGRAVKGEFVSRKSAARRA